MKTTLRENTTSHFFSHAVRALGTTSARHPAWVIGLWSVVVVLSLAVLPQLLNSLSSPPLRVPGSDSDRGEQVIAHGFPGFGNEQMMVVFHSGQLTADDPVHQLGVAAGTTALQGQAGVGMVLADPPMTQHKDSPHTAYAIAGFTGSEDARISRVPAQEAALSAATQEATGGQVTASLVGISTIFADLRDTDLADLHRAEMLALPIAALILLLGLRTIGATVVPLIFAGAVVATGVGLLAVVSLFTTVNTLQFLIAVMMGWALGLDYAVLILLRYRTQLRRGTTPSDAIGCAISTAGTTVCFSSLAIGLCATTLLAVNSPIFRDAFIGVTLMAVVTMTAALTLTPALLSTAGRWLEFGRLPRFRRQATMPDEQGPWARWSRHLMRHPWPYLLTVSAALVIAAVPMQNLRLGLDLDRPALATTSSGQGFLLVDQEMPGLTSAPRLAISRPAGTPAPDPRPLVLALRADPRVAAVDIADNGIDTMTLAVIPTMPADSPDAAGFVDWLRDTAPAKLPAGNTVLVTGTAAVITDLIHEIASKMWWLIGLILCATWVFLLICFRSVLVPVKAILMNLLSTGATFGLLTAFYQSTSSDVLNFYIPVVTFVTVFALSMDYEVFLVRRIQEHYRQHRDNTEAVAAGVQNTALPITLAAAVMVTVFAGLLTAQRIEIRQIGFALATAIAIDATIVRLVLVPATMRLLGRFNWWLPRPLDRFRTPQVTESAQQKDKQLAGTR